MIQSYIQHSFSLTLTYYSNRSFREQVRHDLGSFLDVGLEKKHFIKAKHFNFQHLEH